MTGRQAAATGDATKERMVQAALETLRLDGFSGASARGIAARGGFNQALVFYHFGSVHQLLLAALDASSAARMARYTEVLDGVTGVTGLLSKAGMLYQEDLESGHVRVLCEMVGGGSSTPELGRAVAERVRPWVDFTQRTIDGALAGSPLRRLLPREGVAFPVVALYIGMEMLSNLDGDRARADALFASAQRVANRLNRLLRPRTWNKP